MDRRNGIHDAIDIRAHHGGSSGPLCFVWPKCEVFLENLRDQHTPNFRHETIVSMIVPHTGDL